MQGAEIDEIRRGYCEKTVVCPLLFMAEKEQMASKNFPSLNECPLCHQNLTPREIHIIPSSKPANASIDANQNLHAQESHIVPKFVGKELKKRSNSQTLIDGINPQKNPKPQDTSKEFLLCRQCEDRFSKWETRFRNKVMPTNQSLLAPIHYEDWMLKFLVSVSWRVLTYLKYAPSYAAGAATNNELLEFVPALAPGYHNEAVNALEIWRLFLLGNTTSVSPFNQQLLILNGKNFPYENCNIVGFTIFQHNEIVATNAFMGQFIILGSIRDSSPSAWKGIEISSSSGQIGVHQGISAAYAAWLAKCFAEVEDITVEDWKHKHSSST